MSVECLQNTRARSISQSSFESLQQSVLGIPNHVAPCPSYFTSLTLGYIVSFEPNYK